MNNTYMKFAVSVFIFSSLLSTSVLAQPRCPSVLRSFSAEQINLTFEDLARLTLAADSTKADGSPSNVMNRELKNRVQETLETLTMTREELRRELSPRIARLQNKSHEERKEENRQRETQDRAMEIPKWTLKETITLAVISRIIGISDIIDGSRKIIFMSEFKKDEKSQIEIFDLKTTKVISTEIAPYKSAVDSTGTRLLIYKSELMTNPGRYVQTLQVLSLKTLQFEGPPVEIKWPLETKQLLAKNVEAITLSPDGNTFAIRTSKRLFVSTLNKPDEIILNVEDMTAHQIHFLNEHELIASSRMNKKIKKFDLRSPEKEIGPAVLTGAKTINKIVPVGENTLAMISSDGISYLDTATMTELNRINYEVGYDVAPVLGGREPFYIGIEGDKPVVKNLNNFTQESLSTLDWPTEGIAHSIQVSNDGQAIAIFGWLTREKTSPYVVRIYEK